MLLLQSQGFHSLRENLLNHVPMNVRQATINPVVPHRQPFMIDSEQVKNCGVQVITIRLIFDCLIPPVIALSNTAARFDPCPP